MTLLAPSPGCSTAERIVSILDWLRHVEPSEHNHSEHQKPEAVNWSVVVTNAIGVVVGLSLTASVTGIIYLAWTVPAQQQRMIEGQVYIKEKFNQLDRSDRNQESRITRLEAHNKAQ